MKTIYLVRHGESIGNIGDRYQSAAESLSEHGKTQAKTIAERAKRLNFETLISSTMVRAVETAKIISGATGHEIIYSDLFVERKRPTRLENERKDDPAFFALDKAWWDSLIAGGAKAEDGEDFEELQARGKQALAFLEMHPFDETMVVTHGVFLRMLIALIFYPKTLTPELFEPITRALVTKNTGITVIRYNPEPTGWEKNWTLLVWNDHAHLG